MTLRWFYSIVSVLLSFITGVLISTFIGMNNDRDASRKLEQTRLVILQDQVEAEREAVKVATKQLELDRAWLELERKKS